MLDSLDTLIAFALIFTIVSLLITIVVQMITSFLNLRGKNLAWGIAEAFEAITPELKAEVKGKGKALADYLLKDPLISDSQIGNKVKPASAVRADELFDLLHRIATGKKPGTPAEIKNDVVALLKSLGVPASVFELLASEKEKLQTLKADLSATLGALQDGPAKELLQKTEQDITAKLGNAASCAEDCATRWTAQGEIAIQQVYQKFEHWFQTGQERSQEWFTTHARIITAVLGVAFALVLQLDTIEIYKLVSSNREVRASLVAQVKPVIEQGERILKESPTVMKKSLEKLGEATSAATGGIQTNALLREVQIATTDTPEKVKANIRTVYENAYLKTLNDALNEVPEQEESGKHDDYKKRLNDGYKKWFGTLTDTGLTTALMKVNVLADKEAKKADFTQRVAKVLQEHVAASKELNKVLEDFDDETVKEVQARMKALSEEWNILKDSLNETGFDLFPKEGWRWVKKDEHGKLLRNFWWAHLFGMLLSALLLSLGAPFWFNTLKGLASLRSTVAANISDEKKADQIKTSEASKPPPTVSSQTGK